MAIPSKVSKFLDKAGVKYEAIQHRTVYTAHDKAATLKVAPKIIGKTLLLTLDKNPVIVLIPANKNLDKIKLKKIVKAKKIDFVSERIIKNRIKGVRVGAIPPFGNIWSLPTFTDNALLKNPKIIVNAGDSTKSIKISSAVFKKLVQETLTTGNFAKAR